MRNLLFAGSALIAACVAPVALSAQTAPAIMQASAEAYVLTPEQKMLYDSWTEAQRAAYQNWPGDAQVYYWTLSPQVVPQWWALTDTQRGMLLDWPTERRTAFYGWPAGVQTYYWGLPAPQQQMFWSLAPEQQAMLYQMTPQQQAGVWSAADQRPSGTVRAMPADPGMPGDGAMPAQPAVPGQITIIDNTIPPPPPAAMNKTYPVCTKKLQDSCRNPGGK